MRGRPTIPRLRVRWGIACVLLVVAMPVSACGPPDRFGNLTDIGVCDPATAIFTTDIDNPYFPLPVGQQIVLEGKEFGRDLLVRITVLDETETVAGVETRVVEEYEAKDGRVVEVSRNFFAQNQDGTVCYFGEDVDIYDGNGDITSHAGAWRADGERFLPGIFMLGAPQLDQAFQQEIAPGIAEDQAKVVALGELTEVPAGTFDDTVTMLDLNPLDGSQDTKIYARGIGLIVDETARMTMYSIP